MVSTSEVNSVFREDDEGVWETWENFTEEEGKWRTVSYKKRWSKSSFKDSSKNDDHTGELTANGDTTDAGGSMGTSENGSEVSSGVSENGGDSEGKRPKRGRKKKTVQGMIAELAAKICVNDLRATVVESKEGQDEQLKHLVDVLGQFFVTVDSSQFSCLEFLRKTTLAKMIDVPFSLMPRDLRGIVSDRVAQRNPEVLGSFVLWCLDNIFSDVSIHEAAKTDPKESKVSIFIVLAMVLRHKPDVLIGLLPILIKNPKYLGQDKLPVTIWMIAQASQRDVLVGLYTWGRIFLPLLDCSLDSDSLQCRDLILQLVERILSSPKARNVLLNGEISKGECIIPPSALATLLRLAFPRSSAKDKETERYKAIYLALKDIALTGSPDSKGMKQVTEQMLNHALKAAGEGDRDLSNEARDVSIRCLSKNPDCFKQWDKLYLDNLKSSVVVLRKLSEELIEFPAADKLFRQTLRSFTRKNKQALEDPLNDAAAVHVALLEDSNKYCREILGESSQSHGPGLNKSKIMVAVAVVFGAAAMSLDIIPHWKF